MEKQYKSGIKKREHGLYISRGLTRKCRTNCRYERQRKKHENFVKLERTIENTTGLQFDPAGQIINSNKKQFTKETFKHLNINFNFVPTQTNFNNTTINKELKDIYRHIKLKAYFKNPKSKARFTKEEIFRKPNKKLRFQKQSPQYRKVHRSNTQ